jgi:hypothetical protein
MKTSKIFTLLMFAFILGAGIAIATNTPAAFWAGPALVGANQLFIHLSGFSITNMLGVNLANILKFTGGNNQGGTGTLFKYFLHDDVASWPTFNSTALTDLVTCIGNVTMKANKYMWSLYGTQDACELKIDPVGDIDCVSFKFTLTIFQPKLQKEMLGFMSGMKNESLGMIVRDREGQKYLLGDAILPVKMVPGSSGGTGMKTEDKKGMNLQFEWYGNKIQIYEGTETSGSGA